MSKQKSKMGAPVKHSDKKIGTHHLRNEQMKRMEAEAKSRNISIWAMVRLCIDWSIDELDRRAATVDASAMFDDVLSEPERS